jgi:hypothetical protein
MNGIRFSSLIVDTTIEGVSVSHPVKKDKRILYEKDQLYKIKYANGTSRFYYFQDSLNNWLSQDEMWMYMKGENDARAGFKAKGAFIGSMIAGILGGMTGSFWGPVAPYGYMALSGIFKIKIRKNTVTDKTYLKSEAYIMGYERVARQRLKIRSLAGGTIGLILGYATYASANPYYPESLN